MRQTLQRLFLGRLARLLGEKVWGTWSKQQKGLPGVTCTQIRYILPTVTCQVCLWPWIWSNYMLTIGPWLHLPWRLGPSVPSISCTHRPTVGRYDHWLKNNLCSSKFWYVFKLLACYGPPTAEDHQEGLHCWHQVRYGIGHGWAH